ncbi:MAG: hypothetical protein M1827_003125 [Pycnora praestabilis]|nr:MAG: hypothetical protein M1827_003125 [Pycnora praestabilis]
MDASFNHNEEQHPFLLSIRHVAGHLGTNTETGLDAVNTQEAQRKYGLDKLHSKAGVKWNSVLLKQVSNVMILILVLAMALTNGVTDYVEGVVNTALVFLNVLLGFYQDSQATKKMDSLRSLSSPSAPVIRGENVETISLSEVVLGDVFLVKAGNTIPADLRLFEAMNLEADEKILTGEALPVAKDVELDSTGRDEFDTGIGIGDRVNVAYSSSTVTEGRGHGIVVYTGISIEIGHIAASVQENVKPVTGTRLRIWDAVGNYLGLTEDSRYTFP